MTLTQQKYSSQKAALTRALNKKDPDERRKAVEATCRKTVEEWGMGPWPDDWARWQRALDDVRPWEQQIRLEQL